PLGRGPNDATRGRPGAHRTAPATPPGPDRTKAPDRMAGGWEALPPMGTRQVLRPLREVQMPVPARARRALPPALQSPAPLLAAPKPDLRHVAPAGRSGRPGHPDRRRPPDGPA